MSRLHLFQAFGIEVEYMMVDRITLKPVPLVDSLFALLSGGRCVSDVSKGPVTLSNELALHVLELKTTDPEPDWVAATRAFRSTITSLQPELDRLHARLLPTGMHPTMDPKDVVLWPHENHAIYRHYDEIFDCRTHGWANVQSVHLNLPFADDAEFGRLHAAVRVLLPLLPALTASSPIVGGRVGPSGDMRLEHYCNHCDPHPELIGQVIPEAVFDQRQYEQEIYGEIERHRGTYDAAGVFDVSFLNARGAIARFDRGSIEIRLMDVQECPEADLAVCALVVATLKQLCGAEADQLITQQNYSTMQLRSLLNQTIQDGESALISDREYLALFGIDHSPISAGQLWQTLMQRSQQQGEIADAMFVPLDVIRTHGTLSTRIRKAVGTQPAEADILDTYRSLADCLATGTPFIPVSTTRA